MMQEPKDYAVIYHADWDGMTAAWVAVKYLEHIKHTDSYTLVPVDYGRPFPLDFPAAYKAIYILDFSYDKKTINEVRNATTLVLLDHHVSAQRELEGVPGCVVVPGVSGALLAWQFFFHDSQPPPLVNYVDDHDTWRFLLPHSKILTNTIYSYPCSIGACNHLDKLFGSSEGIERMKQEGQAIERHRATIIRQAMAQKHVVWLGDYLVPACNWPVLVSEIAQCLAADGNHPFGCCYHFDGGQWRYSLRTDKDQVDLSQVAAEFGGGGHPKAAGFRSGMPPLVASGGFAKR